MANGDDILIQLEFHEVSRDLIHRNVNAPLYLADLKLVGLSHIQQKGRPRLHQVLELAGVEMKHGSLFLADGNVTFFHRAKNGFTNVSRITGNVVTQLFHGIHLGAGRIRLI